MDWKALISTVAPWIGTALGGPLGGAAVTAIGSALGLDKATESTIKQALSGVTPEQMLAIKNADQAFSLQMQELGYKNTADLESIAAGDRKDARAMQTANRSLLPGVLSCGITLGFFGILIAMMTPAVTTTPALLLMLGALGTAWGQVVSYWFGTTHESGRKTDLMNAQGSANG